MGEGRSQHWIQRRDGTTERGGSGSRAPLPGPTVERREDARRSGVRPRGNHRATQFWFLDCRPPCRGPQEGRGARKPPPCLALKAFPRRRKPGLGRAPSGLAQRPGPAPSSADPPRLARASEHQQETRGRLWGRPSPICNQPTKAKMLFFLESSQFRS